MTVSIEEFCGNIMQNPIPIVFFDTCVILDTVNAIHSGSLPQDYIDDMLKLLAMYSTDEVQLVTALNVKEEYSDNIDSVVETAEKQIRNIARNLKVMQQLHNTINRTTTTHPDYTHLLLPQHAMRIADNCLRECSIIERKDDYTKRAGDRVRGNTAPAQKGGREFKDCEIIECFFDLARHLKQQSFSKPLIFLTANTKDYGSVGKLRSPLDTQFSEVNAEYANQLGHVIQLCHN